MNKLFDDQDFIVHQKKSFRELDFSLLPFATLLGKKFLTGEIKDKHILLAIENSGWYLNLYQSLLKKKKAGDFHCTESLLYLFDLSNKVTSQEYFKDQIRDFLKQECAFIKSNPKEKLSKENTQSLGDVSSLVTIGAEILLILLKDFKPLREKIRKLNSDNVIDCRYLMRYMLNGWHERGWYQKANKQVREIFPDEDPKLIFDFLAITSQNATIESNTAKFLKALKQLKEGKTYDVHMKLSKNRPKVESTFKGGFLHAQIKYLNGIARDGRFISDGSIHTKSAQKIRNFARAMNGDVNGFALDYWMHIAFKGIETDKVNRKELGSPTASFYRKVYLYVRFLSRITRVEPREIQAMTWVAIRSQRTRRSQMHYAPILKELLKERLF